MLEDEGLSCRIAVLDMQPIDPPIGGGRLRLLGLYHALGLSTTYVGSYDWPGESYRDHMLSETLREIDVPLSAEHHAAAAALSQEIGDKVVIDTAFHRFADLSPEYHEVAVSQMARADVVVMSHPWVYHHVRSSVDRSKQTIVYDSQNVEGYLRYTLLDDCGGPGSALVREVVEHEFTLCHEADLILTCSDEDRELFCRLFDVPLRKMAVVPNGVFTDRITPAEGPERLAAKRGLGLDEGLTVIFLGSNYPPNVEAADFIISGIAGMLPDITFAIAGGVGQGLAERASYPPNVRVTGLLTDGERIGYLKAADFAVNPMFSGSGTNIKMFDFMAAGLPVVSTEIGARGIPYGFEGGIFIGDREKYPSLVGRLARDSSLRKIAGANARRIVEKAYSWEKISVDLGHRFKRLSRRGSERRQRRLAVVSSFGATCGISEYSNYLAQAIRRESDALVLLTTDVTDSAADARLSGADANIPVWHFDNKTWENSSVTGDAIRDGLREWQIRHLNIQYHYAFYPREILVEILGIARSLRVGASVTIHNTKQMMDDWFFPLSELNQMIFVHEKPEVERLRGLGLNRVEYISQGVLEIDDEDSEQVRLQAGLGPGPVIGCFGFLRPHKGLLELIQAFPMVLEEYPDARLLALNARYPSPDSAVYEAECRREIGDLGLDESVRLSTEYLAIESVIHQLHAADITVLPYHESDESASAAANICLASRRPLLVTASGIFSDVAEYCGRLPSPQPEDIADSLISTIKSPAAIQTLRKKACSAVNERNWAEVGRRFVEIIDSVKLASAAAKERR